MCLDRLDFLKMFIFAHEMGTCDFDKMVLPKKQSKQIMTVFSVYHLTKVGVVFMSFEVNMCRFSSSVKVIL